jgi:hypothetical protein
MKIIIDGNKGLNIIFMNKKTILYSNNGYKPENTIQQMILKVIPVMNAMNR